ncbi:aminoglycoside phosphotransferase family protein [Plantibacter sp. ME-Dv--P-122b]|uniref:aminoglycoside phosphotransferase family protein n=1 Tax=Plantibacter sp. ME-Dv--P-122b TaxID=3040300 RepID=UPI00254C213E|nr:aminoglycoside phosphotransferase family protein [Plantibacter sp. ME-Dv--P-122b]
MTWRPGGIDAAVEQWRLVRDGELIVTPSSRLLPVTHRGRPAMLKVPFVEEEALGGRLLAAWGGTGCAAVFAGDDHAIVLERATGGRDLASLTRAGDDLGAVAILCSVLDTLHTAIPAPSPTDAGGVIAELPSLRRWFHELLADDTSAVGALVGDPASAAFLERGRAIAGRLLDTTTPADVVVLHGDLHHMNVLEFSPGDWRAIDPKGIVGHRAFDATALFNNPDPATARNPRLFDERVELVSRSLGLSRRVLLEWVVARSALSAVWSLQDGLLDDARVTVELGRLAEDALG